MSVMTLMEPLLKGVELTPGQLTELRAIDAFYYTYLATHPGNEAHTPTTSSPELDRLVLARVRDMLTGSQRATFDRNRAARQFGVAHDGDRFERRS